jgi:ribA/ribD-fused uncharacterized protein
MMAVYVENDCAVFFRTRDEFGGFSNMHNQYPLELDDFVWPSSEALYQACRFPGRPDIQKAVRESMNSYASKLTAYEYIDHTRPDWDEVKVKVMEMVLRLKVVCHPVRIGTLLSLSGERPIVERSSSDKFWGAVRDYNYGNGILEGQNVLGLLWMLMREELKRDEFVPAYRFEL